MDQPKPPEQPKPWDKPKPPEQPKPTDKPKPPVQPNRWINQNLNVLTKAPGVIPRGFGRRSELVSQSLKLTQRNKTR